MREFRPQIIQKFGPALHIRYDKVVPEPLPQRWTELLHRIDQVLGSKKPPAQTKTKTPS